jgi:thiosulfate reductase cytochrome b subunit
MASAVPAEAVVQTDTLKVVHKHHWLVRVTHWLNVPLLLGLSLSGISIYWASPIYQHAPDATGNTDYLVNIGRWCVRNIPGQSRYAMPDNWFYDHFGLGTGLLAPALRIHWLLVYPFMVNGVLYCVGLLLGGGYKSLLPRRTQFGETLAMMRHYMGLPLAKIRRKPWPHPNVNGKYNALQRTAYAAIPIMGLLAVASGWAIHKPVQLAWLQWLFGGYDFARQIHFWLVWIFLAFVIPHVVLVVASGWDTFRSMITGWSARAEDT